MKIYCDKYYTSPEIAKYCVDKFKKIIGRENVTEYIEPSAGAGVFLEFLDKPFLAYDLYPEDIRITKADWLNVELKYKKGRCVIGNPPYGDKNVLLIKFFRKAVCICDYIAFILPISQWNNSQQLYQFDLIHSENLGIQMYSDRNVHCCFNIYQRPKCGVNVKPPTYALKDITIREVRTSRNQLLPDDFKYDIAICSWGSVGEIVEFKYQYAKETYIRVNNELLKEKVIAVIKAAKWEEIYPMTTSPNLTQWQIKKYLKSKILDLK